MTEQTDAERFEEIRQRWAKTTPGPWMWEESELTASDGEPMWELVSATTGMLIYAEMLAGDEDAIAAAPTDIAFLLALASRAVEAEETCYCFVTEPTQMRECTATIHEARSMG